MKTIMPKQLQNNERKWYVIDATGLTLGRLSTEVAKLLKGKEKVDYAPHLDNGDYVVVLNAEKFAVSGKKMEDKIYYRHTGYLGGLKETPLGKILVKKPTEPMKKAVSGMLPKNKLRAGMLARLKLFTGSEHTFAAQQPVEIKL